MPVLRSLTAQPTTIAAAVALTAGVGLAARLVLFSSDPDTAGKMKVFSKVGPAFVSLKLHSAEDVTHNMKRLRFALPDQDAVSGLGLTTALLTLSWPKGRWTPVARPYTPISPLDAPGYLDLLVKRYPDGKSSTHLHALKPGDPLMFAASIPSYAWKPNQCPRVTLIAGGAGITPMYQLAQGILKHPDDRTRVTLVYAAETTRDLALREQIDQWQKEYPGQFRAVYTVSRDSPEGQGASGAVRKGHVTAELLKEVAPREGEGEAKVLVCGPPAMEKALVGRGSSKGILGELGYRKDQVHTF